MPIRERDQVLLTKDMVAEWRALERDLLGQLQAVRKKLEGARLIGIDTGDEEPQNDGEPLISAIDRILKNAAKALSHDEIRDKLRLNKRFGDMLNKSPNYYYTQLDRLVRRGDAARVGKLFKANEASEDKS